MCLCFFFKTGLAVDYFNERLYWADVKLSMIGSVRLDGSDPVVAVSNIKNSSVLLLVQYYTPVLKAVHDCIS